MVSRISALSLVTVLSAIAAPAHAQLGPVDSLVNDVVSAAGLGDQGKRNGHDKCNGNGHQNGNGNGGGHEEGECDEPAEPTPTGPVGETVCAGVADPESAYQRYSCELTAYNETYVLNAIENNQGYPTTVAAFAADTAEALQAQTTTFATDFTGAIAAGDADGAIAVASGFVNDALDRFLPGTPLPAPGPVVDETLVFAGALITDISSGDVGGTLATTQNYVNGALDRFLPGTPLPAPGPVVDESLVFSGALVTDVSSGDVGGAFVTTQNYADGAVDRYLPGTPLPAPGPVVDEYEVPAPSEIGFGF